MSKAFTLDDIAFLTSDKAEKLLQKLTTEDLSDRNLINLIPKLRGTYSAEQTSAAIETVKLRRKALDKFGDDAAKMLFTQDALEQASDPQIREFRANYTPGAIVDLCCSIGTDTLAFARAGRNVKGIDIDPVRIAIARHNAQKLDYPLEFIIADVTKAQLPDADTVFFDPARRDEYGKRIYDVDKYIPPLSLVRDLRRSYDLVISKLSPGIETQQLEQYAGIVSFLSVNGDLKEAELTLSNSGSFTTAELFLPERIEPIVYYHAETVEATLTDTPAGWLNEPDPAIIRAGYVQHITNDCDGNMLDPTIAYFTTAGKPDSVWVRSWRILDWMPFNLKKLKAYLKQRNVGTVTVKKRGSPITPEELQAKLKLKGNNSLTVVLTRLHGNPIVIICEDYVP